MSRNSQNGHGDAGFALPLALTVLVLLSYVIASGLQRVRVAQADIRLAQANIRTDILRFNLEEDVVWRTLLEAVGRQAAFDLENEQPRYNATAPQSPWRRDGTPFLWSTNYPDITQQGHLVPALVIVQDEVGKIDLNFRNRHYLMFLAERLDIPAGRRVKAVESLTDYIESRTPSPIDLEDTLILPTRTGIQDPDELCTLDIWNQTELCADRERLRDMFTGGLGMPPNILLASPDIAAFLLGGRDHKDEPAKALAWIEVQQRYGFYDLFGTISTGGIKMSVTIIPAGAVTALRFDVDSRGSSQTNPFSIRLRRQVPVAPLLVRLKERSPDVVQSFRAYSGVPESN